MFTTRPEIQGTFGAVASTHWLASSAAMAMLERGGNAYMDREFPKLDRIRRVMITPP